MSATGEQVITPAAGNPAPAGKNLEQVVEDRERYARLEGEVQELKARLAKTENEKTQADRRAKLQALRRVHAFDMDKEIERCSKMNDEQFVDHCGVILEHYQRIPVDSSVYSPESGDLPPSGQTPEETERYSRQVKERAVAIVMEERGKGNDGYAYESALERARAEVLKR